MVKQSDSGSRSIVYRPIGVIHTPHVDPSKTPIQPRYAEGIGGTVEVFPEFEDGLTDIEGFSHVVLLYHLYRAKKAGLTVVPYLDDTPRGCSRRARRHGPTRSG